VLGVGLAFAILVGSSTGCVSTELRDFERARQAYDECLDRFPSTPDRCKPLKAEADARYEEYEEAAREGWNRDDEWRERRDPWE
jgi:hypothetical protein